jgi:tetratricopeptide (TPR) repeat protein
MHWLALIALLTGAFTLATALEPKLRAWSQRPRQAEGLLASVLGDSRRLFANHFFIESDVYLHKGFYPTIFDQQDQPEDEHAHSPAAHEHDEHGHDAASTFFGKPRNWLDAFGRNFYPNRHLHPGEGEVSGAEAREILPWIRLAAELDPQRVETYTVGAYWLRKMEKPQEALQFLREGLRLNPGSAEILFELGKGYQDKQETALARNLWELALRRWQEQPPGREKPENLLLAEILLHLARLEVRENHRDQAVSYLERVKTVSPSPEQVQKRIDEVKAGLPFEAGPK